MEIVVYLAIFMITVGGIFLGIFLFALKKGQFDDMKTPSHKILLDDEVIEEETTKNSRACS